MIFEDHQLLPATKTLARVAKIIWDKIPIQIKNGKVYPNIRCINYKEIAIDAMHDDGTIIVANIHSKRNSFLLRHILLEEFFHYISGHIDYDPALYKFMISAFCEISLPEKIGRKEQTHMFQSLQLILDKTNGN